MASPGGTFWFRKRKSEGVKKWYQWGTCGHISNADIIDDKDYNATLLNGFNSTNHM